MKQTYKERLIAGLLALGYVQDHTDRSHYAAFIKPNHPRKLFVGDAGALRLGECASRSYSIGDPARQTPAYLRVLDAGTPKEASFE